MTQEDFNVVFDTIVDDCRNILCAKNTEYARGGDKLSNFKKAAGAQGITPEKALRGMMVKHSTSIHDYIDDLDIDSMHTLEKWDEKIIDNINYLILLRALLFERWEVKQKMEANRATVR